jgi:N-acetylneuraminic acid mutarotase
MKTLFKTTALILFVSLNWACTKDKSEPVSISEIAGTWTRKADFPIDVAGSTAFVINNKIYMLPSSSPRNCWEYNSSTDIWTKKKSYPGTGFTCGFSNGTNIYVGIGYKDNTQKNDLWQFNPITNTWEQKSNFPGSPRNYAFSFFCNGKAYIGLGVDTNNIPQNDLWEYNISSDTWTLIHDNTSIMQGNYCVMGKYLYIFDGNRLYEYDPVSGTQKEKKSFPGKSRKSVSLFSIGLNLYVCFGYIGPSPSQTPGADHEINDVWEYSYVFDSWVRKKSPPLDRVRSRAFGVSVGSRGYVIGGYNFQYNTTFKECWEFNPN